MYTKQTIIGQFKPNNHQKGTTNQWEGFGYVYLYDDGNRIAISAHNARVYLGTNQGTERGL